MTIAPRFERALARGLGSSRLARAALSLVLSGCALIGGAGVANASVDPGDAIFGARLGGSSTIHVATDLDQNIVVAGSFEGVLEVGGVGGVGGARLVSQDESDIFVAKLSSAGKLVWAERIGGAGTQLGLAVATDLDGNIVVTGSTRAPVVQGSQAPSSEIFVAKLDASGQQVFAMSFGHMHTGIGLGAAVSDKGEITIVGRFSGIARFDDFAIKSSPDANGDAIVLRLAQNGRVLWGHALGGLGEQYAGAVAAAPNGGVVLSGLFSGTLELDGKQHTSTGTPSAFVVAMDDRGCVRFSRNLGPSLGDIPRLAVDPSGDVVVAGTYQGRLELDAGMLLSAGEDDVFALKLDAYGAPVFLRGFGDAGSQQLGGVAVDAQGGIALAMSSLGSVDLGAGPIEGHGGYDVALVKLDALGAPQWGRTFGDHHDQLASDVVVDAAGNIVLAGQFAGSIDLGDGALQATAGFDAFLGSLEP